MFCPACGARVSTDDAFCGSCGTGLTVDAARGAIERTRPGLITVLAILDFLGAVTLLIAGGAMTGMGLLGQFPDAAVRGLLIGSGVVFAAAGVLYGVAGLGLWKLKSYGRTMQIVMAVFGLLAIPIGTVFSILILIYLFNPGIKVLFSGRPLEDLSAAEAAALRKISGSLPVPAIVAIVMALLLVPAFTVGIVAAIAVPGLMRARIAGNEATAVGHIRAIISGELAYAAVNDGTYATLECLATPANCIAGYSGTPFISPDLQRTERSGYRFTFHPGTAVGIGRQNRLDSFAIIAMPVNPRVTGDRGFCGDFTGQVCVTYDGRAPEIANGMCSACEPPR
jgi:type IV pilus assembly protein PilA